MAEPEDYYISTMAEQQNNGVLFFQSPLGWLRVETGPGGLRSVLFCEDRQETSGTARPDNICLETKIQLEEYFAGIRKTFDLPLDMAGTDFQVIVWQELLNIPFSKTISYRELSLRIGNLKAIRAVGHANGQNPLSIIVPCHRVIGSDGSLTGYGGGLWRKKWLLAHEKSLPPELPF